jgi:hypothetical protein
MVFSYGADGLSKLGEPGKARKLPVLRPRGYVSKVARVEGPYKPPEKARNLFSKDICLNLPALMRYAVLRQNVSPAACESDSRWPEN